MQRIFDRLKTMPVYTITSESNKVFKTFESLLVSKGIEKHGQVLAWGSKVCRELISSHPDLIIGLIKTEEMEFPDADVSSTYVLSKKLFKALDPFGIQEPVLVLKTPKVFSLEDLKAGPALAITFQEPQNVGAVLRSAAAFNLNRIVLVKGCAHPFHPKSVRAASGSVFRHQFFSASSLEELQKVGATIALDLQGKPLDRFVFPSNFVLIPGEEGQGLPKNLSVDHRIHIPMPGEINSLNAASATAICLYEWAMKRQK
jgi:TrmH family RNA methyltransferase